MRKLYVALLGNVAVTLPRGGQFKIERAGNAVKVYPLNTHSRELVRTVPPTITEFRDIARRLAG